MSWPGVGTHRTRHRPVKRCYHLAGRWRHCHPFRIRAFAARTQPASTRSATAASRKFLAVAAAAGLLTGGLATAGPAVAGSAAPAAAKALKWGKCAESDLRQAGGACAHTHSKKAGAALVSLYQGVDTPGDDNGFAVYNAVQCTDVQWPTSWAVWSKDNHRVNKIAPFETWGNAWFNAPCLHWPAPASATTPMQINGNGISSALLIDETLDAATPFGGSLEVRQLFPHSVLLAEPGGTTHADSLFGDLCVDNTIANYLASGKLPARNPNAKWDKTCKPLPVPTPSASSASSPGAARALVPALRS